MLFLEVMPDQHEANEHGCYDEPYYYYATISQIGRPIDQSDDVLHVTVHEEQVTEVHKERLIADLLQKNAKWFCAQSLFLREEYAH